MHTSFSSADTSAQQPEAMTLDRLHKLIAGLKLDEPHKWVVMDPHGTVHVGTVEQMISLLVSAHPLTAFTPIQEQSL